MGVRGVRGAARRWEGGGQGSSEACDPHSNDFAAPRSPFFSGDRASPGHTQSDGPSLRPLRPPILSASAESPVIA